MDTNQTRNEKRNLPPTILDNPREIKHKCKQCKKEFTDKFLKNICPKCYKRLKKQTHKCSQTNHNKEKWLTKLGPIEIMMPAKEKWDENYFQAITTKECAQCQQKHKKGEHYYHTYKQNTKVLGLPIHEIQELLEEYKCEFKNKRTITNKFLQDRGLEIKEVKE